MSVTPDSTSKLLTALNDVVILEPIALSFITAIKKAIQSGNGSVTVDQLITEAEAGWDKAQADLDDLAKQ